MAYVLKLREHRDSIRVVKTSPGVLSVETYYEEDDTDTIMRSLRVTGTTPCRCIIVEYNSGHYHTDYIICKPGNNAIIGDCHMEWRHSSMDGITSGAPKFKDEHMIEMLASWAVSCLKRSESTVEFEALLDASHVTHGAI